MATISPPSLQKIAFITGGNRGIGFETAKQLGQLGILPVIGVRNAEAGQQALTQLREAGVEAEAIVFDATKRADREKAFAYFESRAGRLDILINNAGVYLEGEPGVAQAHTASNVPEHVLRDTLETNFFAPVALTQLLLPLLRKSAAGRIVNLSSILGSLTLHSDPTSPIYEAKATAYDSSKTALNAYTVHLGYELKDSAVKVNSAHPGWVQTSMGGSAAPMSVVDGARTSVILATLPADGPNGGFFHMNDPLPW
ncbi:short-chain dehydrogenase [Rhodoferax koreense]|uniref:Short-chain dehydrogenase n=1 Tax=Rhodoferax koreensis TaxID=1842727 RepID=A0A1P8K2I2_9BURK|nr:SDR family oxidoreductase [Rhodoferax koreense]APW40141.1 short-chain dehydrogenase [Rhodoferax koreense]